MICCAQAVEAVGALRVEHALDRVRELRQVAEQEQRQEDQLEDHEEEAEDVSGDPDERLERVRHPAGDVGGVHLRLAADVELLVQPVERVGVADLRDDLRE